MGNCLHCGKETPYAHNYCNNTTCLFDAARANGAVEYLPNGLPIRCITRDGLLIEHEHGDHADYIFPVAVDYEGPDPNDGALVDGDGNISYDAGIAEWQNHQVHALIYYDGNAAITLYEYCYAFWEVKTRTCVGLLGGLTWEDYKLNLTDEQKTKLKERIEKKRVKTP